MRIGYFGSSTGGAAALVAAAELPQDVGAVVSRGGRPDLAGDALPKVQAPTLLIVGGNDDIVIELNEMARDQMRCEVKLEIIPGATHLFEEPGALEQVAKLASDWFSLHLGREWRIERMSSDGTTWRAVVWGAHAARVLASASARSQTFVMCVSCTSIHATKVASQTCSPAREPRALPRNSRTNARRLDLKRFDESANAQLLRPNDRSLRGHDGVRLFQSRGDRP